MTASAHSERPSRLRHPALLGLAIAGAPLLWVVFVGTLALHELLVGALCAAATVAFTFFVCAESDTRLTLRVRDVAQGWRLPWYVASGVCDITLVLVKDLLHWKRAENLYRVCGFDASTHDSLRMARTVMAVAYTTASPNFIVVGVDPAQSRMLFHQISPSRVPQMTKALGAKS